MLMGAGVLGGLVLVGCGFAVPAPPGPMLNILPPTAPTTTTTTAPTARTTPPEPVSPAATEAPLVPPVATTAKPAAPRPHTAPPNVNEGGNGGWCDPGFFAADGNCAHDPAGTPGGAWPPPGAVARCHDGTYGFDWFHTRTCAGHGGVAQSW